MVASCRGNLVPRVSPLHVPGSEKKRDPGNEVESEVEGGGMSLWHGGDFCSTELLQFYQLKSKSPAYLSEVIPSRFSFGKLST